MTASAAERSTLAGAAWAAGAMLVFSLNDMLIKGLSGDYPLHQVMAVRAIVALAVLLGVLVPLLGGYGQLRTRRIGMHVLRGGFVVMANLCFFLGLGFLQIPDRPFVSGVTMKLDHDFPQLCEQLGL